MPELQLKVVKNTGDGIWGKALNNFNKVLYSSGGGLFNIVINSKRNALLRASNNYEAIVNVAKESKRKQIAEKYEKVYDNYLYALEKYITDTIYSKVQKRVSTIKENKVLSEYYEINSLKGTEYSEYKLRRQLMYLKMDFDNILASKSGYFIERYKNFYTNVVDQLYRSLMRHYSVKLTNKNENKSAIFEKIYNLIDSYMKDLLPYLPTTEGRKRIMEEYKKLIEPIDMYAKKEINTIRKQLYLLELGGGIFAYSLPILATEESYLDLIARARQAVPNIYITADKFEMYNLLLEAIESYYTNVQAQKTIWDKESEKEEFNAIWDKLTEYKKLERIDLNEYKRVREILLVTEDIKYLKNSGQDLKELRAYYRERLKTIGGLRKFKNSVKKTNGNWKTRRRCEAN